MTTLDRVASKAASVLLENSMGKATGLGLVLRQHRVALGLSLRNAGKAAGISGATLCEMELGIRFNPTLFTIRGLTKLYKLKPAAWFSE